MYSRIILIVSTLVGASLVSGAAQAVTYTLTSDSHITLASGTMSATLSGAVNGSGSGSIVEQAPGSLTTGLSGEVNVEIAGSNINLTTSLVVANSGVWEPTGAPANIGAKSTFLMDFAAPYPDSLVTVWAAVSNVAGSVSGSSTLSGPAGNQTFGLTGLSPTFASGSADVLVDPAAALYPNMTYANISLSSFVFSFNGNGSLVMSGGIETLTIPFTMDSVYSMSGPVDGYPTIIASATASLHREGMIVAVRPVPEPGSWAMLLAGLGLVGVAARRRT